MTVMTPVPPAATGGTEIFRFNALRHGALSHYTVLPRENWNEYQALIASLIVERAPQGPTAEQLVKDLASILRCPLRRSETAAHRRGLDGALAF